MAIRLVHPLPGGRKTDAFGWRAAIPGIVPASRHTGQDFAAPHGTPIRAAHAGRVTRTWWDTFKGGRPAGGNMLELDGGSYATRYAHMSRYAVSAGDEVKAGQIIGYVGATGAAVGNHLHFELLIHGQFADPMPYIRAIPKPSPLEPEEEEEPMKAIYYKESDTYHVAVIHPVSGLFAEYSTTSAAYNNEIAAGLDTGSFTSMTKGHYFALKADFAKIRARK